MRRLRSRSEARRPESRSPPGLGAAGRAARPRRGVAACFGFRAGAASVRFGAAWRPSSAASRFSGRRSVVVTRVSAPVAGALERASRRPPARGGGGRLLRGCGGHVGGPQSPRWPRPRTPRPTSTPHRKITTETTVAAMNRKTSCFPLSCISWKRPSCVAIMQLETVSTAYLPIRQPRPGGWARAPARARAGRRGRGLGIGCLASPPWPAPPLFLAPERDLEGLPLRSRPPRRWIRPISRWASAW